MDNNNSNNDFIASHDEFAEGYDSQVKEYNSYGHEALFGMCYEYITPGETLLDLGIGTGLGSVPFARAGLEVTGVDGSAGMLKQCEKKGFARELRQYDIRKVPLPFSKDAFSNIISCGVLHFFDDLRPLIGDACRILKPNGIFAFTIASFSGKNDYIEVPTAWGIPIFKHSDNYINNIAESMGLTIQKQQKVLVDSGDKDSDDILFKIIVAQKMGS